MRLRNSSVVPAHDDEPRAPALVEADEREWVERVRAGDRAAFESIYRSYYRRLVGFIYTYVRSETLAEELVQDIFLAIWRQRAGWDLRTTLRAYLFGCARNSALNHRRHEGVTQAASHQAMSEGRMLGMGEAPAALDSQLEADDLALAARAAISRLPPRCRMAFTLCRGHGLSYAEAAEVMGISESTVKIQMARALAALRVALARWIG
jgi:RNA polymerase sigma-70 factor (ECF subfamily)